MIIEILRNPRHFTVFTLLHELLKWTFRLERIEKRDKENIGKERKDEIVI